MSQSLSCLWVHIIFSTKNRRHFLRSAHIRDKLYQYIIGTSKALNAQIGWINGTSDHIHILVNIPKVLSVSEYIKKIKYSSSKLLKKLAVEKKELSNFYWQSGYAAFSVSESKIGVVKNYIKNQESHHKKFDYFEELKKILEAHNIQYNEEYLKK